MACLDENQILALVGGQLDADALAQADRHIDGCASCRQLIAWADRTVTRDRSSRAGPAPGEDQEVPLSRGLSVGRYLLLGRVGAGGMGVVYSAYDPELDRRVAIKLIRADQGGAGTVAERQARLLREARAMARLQHPDVIAVHDAGAVGDQVFLAMEYVDGTTLREWLAASPRSWREVLAVFLRVGRGLAAAHAAGLVHRDFKPDNVLVGKDGRVRVTDFGLARLMSPAPVTLEGGPDSGLLPAGPLTRTGQLFGSPAYMAPEQMDGGATDARADLFSFCVALYEALYGERPFPGRTVEELRQNIAAGDIGPPPKSFRVPERVRRALLRGLRAKPDERCGSMDELLRELERDPVGRRRLVVGSLLVAALVAAVSVPLWRSGTQRRLLCRGGEAQVAAVWSAGRRDEVARAFRATGLPYVEPLLASLGNGLDGWARSWSAMYRDACEATRVRGEQSDELLDLRMQCLSEHLIEARAVVDQLAAADRGLVEHADRVLAGLAPLDRCAKPAQLRAQDPEPTMPEAAATLAHLREAQAVARTLTLVQPAKAGSALDPLLAEARKLGFRPLLSEVLITAGDEERYRGAREQAEASLQEAALQASLSGRHDLAGRALGTLIELNGYAGKLDEALHYSDLARAEIERSGEAGDDEASRLKGIGRVLALYGRFDAALPALQRAVALREQRGDWQGLSDALCALAEALGRAGRGREGLDIGRRCVSLVEQELGPMHPRVALALNLGLLFSLSALGETDEEEKVLRRVVEIEERSLPSDHWQLGLHLNNLGEALRKQGRCGEALGPLERAVAIAERRLPSSAVVVATMLGNLGACLVDLGRAAQARAHLERAKELAGSVTSAPPEVLSDVRFHLARALWDSGGSRSAARALATEARKGFAALPERRMDLAEADRWLAEH